MDNFYGVRPQEQGSSVGTPTAATSGIVIAFGTAPVHQVDGTTNAVVLANNWDEAVAAMGYSDNWEKYTLCEVMDSQFKRYGKAPLLLVNVLDPEKHKESVAAENHTISNGQVVLSGDVIASSIAVTGSSATYKAGTDYDVFYSDGSCIVEMLSGGAIDKAALSTVKIAYSKVSFQVDDLTNDLIGGYNVKTGERTGLELMDMAYFSTRTLPGLLIAPGFSHKSKVAAVMAAKTTFSTVFSAFCICDMDTGTAADYNAAITAKRGDSCYRNPAQIVCWPMLKKGDRVYHYSTQLAGLQNTVDADNNGIPSMTASNQVLQADAAILADGTEMLLDLTAANHLRAEGIVTAYNFINGFTAWGIYTACQDASDIKERYINLKRMFGFIANTTVLTFWSRIDERLTPRYAESIVDEINEWLDGLTSSGDLYGARCELKPEENPIADLEAGIVRVHIYMAPPFLAQEIDFVLEYDISYAQEALAEMAME